MSIPISILNQYNINPNLPSLRNYQVKVVTDTYKKIKEGKRRVIVVAPTGSGKTKTSASMVYDAAMSGKQVAFVVHRDTLIDQTYNELVNNWHLPCSVIAGGYEENRNARVQICSFQSLGGDRDLTWLKPTLVIADECLTGDSLVTTKEGIYRIDDPNLKGKHALSYNESTQIWQYKRIIEQVCNGTRATVKITTAQGQVLQCTPDHEIRTLEGWKQAKDLVKGDRVLSSTVLAYVATVKSANAQSVYDIEVADNHNFLANGLLVKNCHLTSFTEIMLKWFPKLEDRRDRSKEPHYVGLTGSVWRSNKRESLGEIFEALVCAPMPKQLIEMGYLVKPSYYRVPNCHGKDMLADIGYILQQWRRVGQNDQTIAFCPNVKFAKQMTHDFKEIGVNAETISESTSRARRRSIFDGFKRHEIKIINSVSVIAEGFDATNARVAILLQNLWSRSRIVQEIGRVVRAHRYADGSIKTDCIILDAMGLLERLGFLFEDMNITEEDLILPDLINNEPGMIPMKECPYCHVMNPIQTHICKKCGMPFDIIGKKREMPKGNMERLPMQDTDAERFSFYCRNLRLAFNNGKPPEWAEDRYRLRYNAFPPQSWRSSATLGRDSTTEQQEAYKEYLSKVAFLSNKSKNWVATQLSLELGI